MPFLAALGDLLKDQPDIPKFKPISAADEQVRAIDANRGAIASIKALAKEVDSLTAEQFQARLSQLVPDSRDILSSTSRNIASMSRGEIPEDVASAVERRSAASAYAGGYSGSQRAGFLRTRDLGLTSLDLTQKGLDNATKWLQMVNTASPQFDVTSMFLTPQQQLENTWKNTAAEMNNKWMRNQQEAEGSLGTIFGNALNQTDSFIQQIAASAVGSAGGMTLGRRGAASGAPGGYATSYPPDGPPIYSRG
jgi:hypothetical protein